MHRARIVRGHCPLNGNLRQQNRIGRNLLCTKNSKAQSAKSSLDDASRAVWLAGTHCPRAGGELPQGGKRNHPGVLPAKREFTVTTGGKTVTKETITQLNFGLHKHKNTVEIPHPGTGEFSTLSTGFSTGSMGKTPANHGLTGAVKKKSGKSAGCQKLRFGLQNTGQKWNWAEKTRSCLPGTSVFSRWPSTCRQGPSDSCQSRVIFCPSRASAW